MVDIIEEFNKGVESIRHDLVEFFDELGKRYSKIYNFWFGIPLLEAAPASLDEKEIEDMSSLLEQYKKENQQLKDTLANGALNTQGCLDQVSNVQKRLKEEQIIFEDTTNVLQKLTNLEDKVVELEKALQQKTKEFELYTGEANNLLEKAEQKIISKNQEIAQLKQAVLDLKAELEKK